VQNENSSSSSKITKTFMIAMQNIKPNIMSSKTESLCTGTGCTLVRLALLVENLVHLLSETASDSSL
jgi:hypothetical protein